MQGNHRCFIVHGIREDQDNFRDPRGKIPYGLLQSIIQAKTILSYCVNQICGKLFEI